MNTRIGDYLRRLRMKNSQILKDMAEILGVSSAFLSAVENGKKNMPEAWYSVLQIEYSLTEEEMDNLRQAAMESQKVVSLNIQNASESKKQLAVSFAREFDNLDENTSNMISEMLWRRRKMNKKEINQND